MKDSGNERVRDATICGPNSFLWAAGHLRRDLARIIVPGKEMIIFYSGDGSVLQPETCLGWKANLMMSFERSGATGKPDARFRRIIKAREKRQKEEEQCEKE